MDPHDHDQDPNGDDVGRSSVFESPTLRRRCVAIEIHRAEPAQLEVTLVSRKLSPPRPLARILERVPGFRIVRGLRRVFGKKRRTRLSFRPGGLRNPSLLSYGDLRIAPETVSAVALQGWQEDSGHPRVWDVMLLGPNVDIVVGHRSYDEAKELAEKIGMVLSVPVEESSVIGGAVTVVNSSVSVRDAHYDSPQVDGWRHLKPK